MTLHVLEFNDLGIRVSDDSGVLVSSPGYALVAGQRIEFGERARKQSRLNPLNCFNQFWHKLNLEPFARPVAHYRHNADIAYSHLREVAAEMKLEGDVLLAVPGNFSRQQLAILLGLIQPFSFRAVGVVDSGLAAALDHAHSDSIIHADIQLHQVVLTKLQRQGGELVRESVVQVPGTGWANMSDALIQLLTNAFVQQCRFNPQQNAESEQTLFDGLPGWLRESATDSGENKPDTSTEESRQNLVVSIYHNHTLHQARVSRSSLSARLQPFFQKICQQMNLLDPTGKSRLLAADRLQGLPGFAVEAGKHFSRLSALDEHAVGGTCLRYQEALRSAPEAVQFVTRLRQAGNAEGQVPQVAHLQPTHALQQHRAHKLADGMVIRKISGAGGQVSLQLLKRGAPATSSVAADGGLTLGEVAFDAGHFTVRMADTGNTALQINGSTVQTFHRLQLGDRIQLLDAHDFVDLIRIQESDE